MDSPPWCGTGLAENVARESGQRIIGTRWVTNEKEEAQEGVRARIVAKDFASGQSARSMGISSPTRSIECLRMVLGVACGAWSVENQAVFLIGLDVSQAFMNSPLERPVILRMLLSMSTMKGEPICLWLRETSTVSELPLRHGSFSFHQLPRVLG